MPPIKYSAGESPQLVVNRMVWTQDEFLDALDNLILRDLMADKTMKEIENDVKALYAECLAPMIDLAEHGDPVNSKLAKIILADIDSDKYAAGAMIDYVPNRIKHFGYKTPRSEDRKPWKNRRKWKPLLRRL